MFHRLLLYGYYLFFQIHKNYTYTKILNTIFSEGQALNYKKDGFLVFLLAKLINHNIRDDDTKVVKEKQQTLICVVMAIQISMKLLGCVNNTLSSDNSKISEKKVYLLLADFILSETTLKLSKLQSNDIFYLLHAATRDVLCNFFVGQNYEIPSNPLPRDDSKDFYDIVFEPCPIPKSEDIIGRPKREWIVRKTYSGPIIVARCCQAAALVANLPELQEKAFYFGCYIALAEQAARDLFEFKTKSNFSLTSAPVMFAISENPNIFSDIIAKINDVNDKINYQDLKNKILNTDALNKSKKVHSEYLSKAAEQFEDIKKMSKADPTVVLIEKLLFSL